MSSSTLPSPLPSPAPAGSASGRQISGAGNFNNNVDLNLNFGPSSNQDPTVDSTSAPSGSASDGSSGNSGNEPVSSVVESGPSSAASQSSPSILSLTAKETSVPTPSKSAEVKIQTTVRKTRVQAAVPAPTVDPSPSVNRVGLDNSNDVIVPAQSTQTLGSGSGPINNAILDNIPASPVVTTTSSSIIKSLQTAISTQPANTVLPSSSASSAESSPQSSGLSPGLIAGIVIIVLFFMGIIGTVLFFITRSKRRVDPMSPTSKINAWMDRTEGRKWTRMSSEKQFSKEEPATVMVLPTSPSSPLPNSSENLSKPAADGEFPSSAPSGVMASKTAKLIMDQFSKLLPSSPSSPSPVSRARSNSVTPFLQPPTSSPSAQSRLTPNWASMNSRRHEDSTLPREDDASHSGTLLWRVDSVSSAAPSTMARPVNGDSNSNTTLLPPPTTLTRLNSILSSTTGSLHRSDTTSTTTTTTTTTTGADLVRSDSGSSTLSVFARRPLGGGSLMRESGVGGSLLREVRIGRPDEARGGRRA
ncbi:hypothetical protein HDU97_002801 [Phlyctochytrium planicorne]|nr:hypothetical protein HDU97_002801 [Phlyctochytrium planicorne]